MPRVSTPLVVSDSSSMNSKPLSTMNALRLAIVPDAAELALQAEDAARVEADRAHAVEAEAVAHVVGEWSERLTVGAGDAGGVPGLALRGEGKEQKDERGDDPIPRGHAGNPRRNP